jgi:hypothetical protein
MYGTFGGRAGQPLSFPQKTDAHAGNGSGISAYVSMKHLDVFVLHDAPCSPHLFDYRR